MDVDLSSIYIKYKGLWVALDNNLKQVLASSKNAKDAYDKALRKKKGIPTLFKVPKRGCRL